MKFVGYARVSDKEQAKKGFSIPAQQEAFNAWAAENNHRLVKILVEPGRSGSKSSRETRPTFESGVAFVLAGGADGLVVKWMDRFARNVEDFLRVRSQFYQAGKHLVSISEPLLNGDPHDPIARYIAVAIMNAYQLQAELSGLKASQGRERRAKAGHYPGRVPIGYLRREGQIIIDPDQGPMIAASFAAFSSGRYTLDSWVAEAETRGYRNNRGKPINKGAWHRVFRSTFYVGRYKWKGEEYAGDYETLIDEAIFETVQELLDSSGPGTGQEKHFWLLSKLLWSDVHHKLMTGALIKKQFRYYRATGHGREHNVNADEMESRVVDFLQHIIWTGDNPYHLPDHWRLAFAVATHMGQIFNHLPPNDQQGFLRLIFLQRGIHVAAGGAITSVDLLPGFEVYGRVDVR